MVNHRRLTRPFAAALAVAAALWMLPASAIESSDVSGAAAMAGAAVPTATETRSSTETPRPASGAKPYVARPRIVERPKQVRYQPRRRIDPPYYPRIRETFRRECYGIWCGRPFVLLLGVGF
jgi:hypothetical protein